MGALLRDQEKYEEAELLLAPAVESARLVLSREHVTTGALLCRYGEALTGLGRYSEAEAELLEAHEILTEVAGAGDDRTQKAVQALVDLYEAWGKPDMAEEWRGKLEGSAE